MFGEELTNQSISLLPQEQKDMILKSLEGQEGVNPNLIKALKTSDVNELASDENVDRDSVVTLNQVMDKPVSYNGKRATILQDGQTVIAKIEGENTEYELGNINEIGESDISDFGIEAEESVVDTNEAGDVVVRGKVYKNNYSDPMAAVNYDADGNVRSVTLDTEDGQKRTFRGAVAEDLAYQIQLKEISKDNESRQQFEDFVAGNEQSQQEIVLGENEIASSKQAEESTKDVQREPAERRKAEPKQRSAAEQPKSGTVNSVGEKTKNPSAAVEIVDEKNPKAAATAYEESAARLEEQGDTEGATKLKERAKALREGNKTKEKVKITSAKQFEDELKNIFALDNLLNIKKIANAIKAGTSIFKRFSQAEQRGLTEGGTANVEASVIAGTKNSTDKSVAKSNEAQKDASSQDKIATIKVGNSNNTIQQYLDKAKAVLNQLYPDATITT